LEGKLFVDIVDICTQLCSGAFAIAYSAQNKITKQFFCIKVVKKETMEDPQVKKQIDAESQLLQKLNHPHIVRCIETFSSPDGTDIVLELCEGGTLEEDVKSHPYSEAQSAKVMYQILTAVGYMHDNKMAHRDLKPENIMFSDKTKSFIKLVDFGFGKELRSDATLNNTILGTPDYLAPEMVQARDYDYYKIDIYQCGVITYYLLYGRTPFQHVHQGPGQEFFRSIIEGRYKFDPNVPVSKEAQDFVKQLMNLDPDVRPSSSEALAHPWLARYRGSSQKGLLSLDAKAEVTNQTRKRNISF